MLEGNELLRISLRKKLAVGAMMYLPSSLKILVYRLMGAEIGANVHIGLGSYIFAERIILRDHVVIGNDVHIVCKEITMDEEAIIDDEGRIGGESTCMIGKGCFLGSRSYINVAKPVILEDDVGMGGHIYTHGVWPSYLDGYPRKLEGVTIKKEAWVPPDTTILPGVTIGEQAIIGTGAVVTKSIPSRVFAAGVPASVVRSVDEMQIKLDENQKDTRFKEIISDFKEWIKNAVVIENNKFDGIEFALVVQMKHFFSAKRWGLYYTPENMTPDLVEKLLALRSRFTKIAVVSLKGIDEQVLAKMTEKPELVDFLAWITLENRSFQGKKDYFLILLRRFLRSYYGVRLRTRK